MIINVIVLTILTVVFSFSNFSLISSTSIRASSFSLYKFENFNLRKYWKNYKFAAKIDRSRVLSTKYQCVIDTSISDIFLILSRITSNSLYLSMYISIYLSIYLSTYPRFIKHIWHLVNPIQKNIHLTLSIYLCIFPSIYPSIYLYMHLSIYLSTYPRFIKHIRHLVNPIQKNIHLTLHILPLSLTFGHAGLQHFNLNQAL